MLPGALAETEASFPFEGAFTQTQELSSPGLGRGCGWDGAFQDFLLIAAVSLPQGAQEAPSGVRESSQPLAHLQKGPRLPAALSPSSSCNAVSGCGSGSPGWLSQQRAGTCSVQALGQTCPWGHLTVLHPPCFQSTPAAPTVNRTQQEKQNRPVDLGEALLQVKCQSLFNMGHETDKGGLPWLKQGRC